MHCGVIYFSIIYVGYFKPLAFIKKNTVWGQRCDCIIVDQSILNKVLFLTNVYYKWETPKKISSAQQGHFKIIKKKLFNLKFLMKKKL